eukprot:TRINITY_DN1285_c3_g1_i1.p1 TRINITY_DN1285_c3_g1~~TRINITY_DN1285_c3_g1_i1.p1  ORF type:complete len:295 (-),score=46.42 TRINITY_DN1285_c3_g1_i1:72-956(-)
MFTALVGQVGVAKHTMVGVACKAQVDNEASSNTIVPAKKQFLSVQVDDTTHITNLRVYSYSSNAPAVTKSCPFKNPSCFFSAGSAYFAIQGTTLYKLDMDACTNASVATVATVSAYMASPCMVNEAGTTLYYFSGPTDYLSNIVKVDLTSSNYVTNLHPLPKQVSSIYTAGLYPHIDLPNEDIYFFMHQVKNSTIFPNVQSGWVFHAGSGNYEILCEGCSLTTVEGFAGTDNRYYKQCGILITFLIPSKDGTSVVPYVYTLDGQNIVWTGRSVALPAATGGFVDAYYDQTGKLQ